jgi:two-component system chemotaxis response regulator CheB
MTIPVLPVVGIVASTGGPQALREVLSQLEGLDAAVLIVQHIHHDFVDGLAEMLGLTSPLPISVATDGQRLQRGRVLIAPGGCHLRLSAGRRTRLDAEPATLHRPSATLLLESIAEYAGASGIGVVLTGMGDDGAAGLLAIRRNGGTTLAQDESSSAVYGMPLAAVTCGAAMRSLPLGGIAAAIREAVAGLPV